MKTLSATGFFILQYSCPGLVKTVFINIGVGLFKSVVKALLLLCLPAPDFTPFALFSSTIVVESAISVFFFWALSTFSVADSSFDESFLSVLSSALSLSLMLSLLSAVTFGGVFSVTVLSESEAPDFVQSSSFLSSVEDVFTTLFDNLASAGQILLFLSTSDFSSSVLVLVSAT